VQVDATLDELVATIERVADGPRHTITPGTVAPASSGALDLLRRIDAGDYGARFEMQRTLGEGGMGIVRLAEQKAMGRMVAVKTVRPEVLGDRAIAKILQEAWVTGILEHPNVVPVYDIGLDDEGRPLIVLKRIEGEQWGELMGDPERVEELHGATDLLEWNVQIAIEVCQALRYAHSRQILHRDLKPENVMIGEFGEVYVLDWGIAVALEDDGTGRLPLAHEATEMAGTPAYMAPEMLGGEAPNLGPATDVYLVGAMLFEMLTGHPPHDGESFQAILSSIVHGSPPEIPGEVPAELSRIVRRAMAADPDARFENADQLRLALQGFLQHRGSNAMVERADARLRELEAALAQGNDEVAQLLYGECSFGYRGAIEAWRQNQAAHDGLEKATVIMARHELSRDDPEAALRLLQRLDRPPLDVKTDALAAKRKKKLAQRELERIRSDEDETIGRRTRTFVTTVLGTTWVLAPAGMAAFDIVPSFSLLFWSAAVMGALVAGIAYWARDSLSRTRLNRAIASAIMVAVLGQFLVGGVAMGLGLGILRTPGLILMAWTLGTAYVSATVHPAFWPSVVCFTGFTVAAVQWPERAYWFMSGANTALLVNMLLVNRVGIVVRELQERRQVERDSRRNDTTRS